MTIDELKEQIDAYFGDTRRAASETREDLLDLAGHCEMLADTIPTEGGTEGAE